MRGLCCTVNTYPKDNKNIKEKKQKQFNSDSDGSKLDQNRCFNKNKSD
jgi:hypothetical protein